MDGVLTPNAIHLNAEGVETKSFFVPDGFGIRLLKKQDIAVAFISGRRSRAVEVRAHELGIRHAFHGIADKVEKLMEVTTDLGITAEQVLFMGDDMIDLPAMKWSGHSAAPADAHAIVLERADWVTHAAGGRGAVREVCEGILRASGQFDSAVERWLS